MIGLAKLRPGDGHLALAERPDPVARPGNVVLDVLAAGICGTDLHIERGEYGCVPPVTLGHEACGVVAGLGDGVDPAWLGERVVTETYFSTCERCLPCLTGRRNLCQERRSIGTHVDGAFAPRLEVPARNLHRVPAALPAAAAALCEPFACVCNAMLGPPVVAAGDAVLVVGPGTIGLLAAQLARLAGGRVVLRGTPRDEARLALAAELGLGVSVAGEEPTWPDGVDAPAVTLECSGSDAGIREAFERTAPGGHLVQIGLRGADVTVPLDLVSFRELIVTSGMASTPGSWVAAMQLVHAGAIALEPLVTTVGGLDAWEDLFGRSRRADGIKFVIDPRN